MDINLKSRFDHFLAKAAGVDSNLDSINPPVPTNQTEELFNRLDGRISAIEGGGLSSDLKWGSETHGAVDASSATLPAVEDATAINEIVYTFSAAGTSYSFTAPSGYILGDDDGFAGLTSGNTITYSDMVVGSIYEFNFKVIDATHIALVKKEWKTA